MAERDGNLGFNKGRRLEGVRFWARETEEVRWTLAAGEIMPERSYADESPPILGGLDPGDR